MQADSEARRLAAEAQTRRGLEESVRLLDEQLGRVTARAEREAAARREAAEEKLTSVVQSLKAKDAHAARLDAALVDLRAKAGAGDSEESELAQQLAKAELLLQMMLISTDDS